VRRLSDKSDRSSAGPFTLVLRAAFVPEGEQPPPELAADFSPLTFRATLDRSTGTITCDEAGTNFGGDIQAEWHPDEAQGSDDIDDQDSAATAPEDEDRPKPA
jgi:hypothetical protein